MKLRLSILSLLAVVVSLLGFAGPAAAVTPISDQQMCNARTDFTAFFRNHDAKDKYCFNNSGPTTIFLNIERVTWFNAGANSGSFEFWDSADGRTKSYSFDKGNQTGCTYCTILSLTLDP